MRPFNGACRAFVASASLIAGIAASGAQAQGVPVKDVFEKYNLLGTFAIDCSKPASAENFYYVARVIDAEHVQRDRMTGPTTRNYVSIYDKATPLGPNEVDLNGKRTEGLGNGTPVRETWRVEPNRVAVVEMTFGSQKLITGGKFSDGKPTWWANRCAGR